MDIWEVLGIQATTEITEIRSAFSRRMKDHHPEDDPKGFQRVCEAYHAAVARSRQFTCLSGDGPSAPAPVGDIRECASGSGFPAPQEALRNRNGSGVEEADEFLDFAALIAKGVRNDLQPQPPRHGRLYWLLKRLSPNFRA